MARSSTPLVTCSRVVMLPAAASTSATLIPAMADKTEHITMLQRSPTYVVSRPDKDGIAIKYSTDVSVSERQEKELSDLGLIPLTKSKDTEYSVFYSNQSAQRPKRYNALAADVNARMSAMLQYMFCVGRFAHYVKVIGRDRVGSYATPEECQRYLRQWLLEYTNADDDATNEQKAKYPLREADVEVRENPGNPGIFNCTIHLRPHFQLDQVISSFKLVTEVAAQEGA